VFTIDYTNSIEIRLRLAETKLPWEEILPIQGTASSPADAQVAAYEAALKDPDCIEVRWNWKGSLQGHYVTPHVHRFLAQFRVFGSPYSTDSGWQRLEVAREYVQAIFESSFTFEEARVYDQVLKTYPYYIAH